MGLLFPELAEPQQGFGFPRSLTEKYQPLTVAGFAGLTKAKTVLANFLKVPRPIAFCFVGDPGRGKTAMAFALANDLGASIRYVAAQKFTVEELDRTWEAVHYFPPKGKFWVVIADEADQMTDKAQPAWLSKGDCAASLKPVMGGAFERGVPLPVVWAFTCNSTERFERRFLSRCTVLDFSMYGESAEIAAYLARIWDREAPGRPAPNLTRLVKDCASNVRDCLIQVDRLLLEAE